MNFTIETLLLSGGMFLAVLLFLEVGRRIGLASKANDGKEPAAGAVDAAVYGLLGAAHCVHLLRSSITV